MNKKITIAEIFFMLLITASLFSQNYNYISDYDNQGVPLDMVNTQVSQNLLDNINASFPEGFPVPEYNPQYIADDVETNVILTQLADVWVTFIGEGAGYKNVLGYYTYDAFNPPTSPPSDEDITIIFPNVSAAGSGGGLLVGDKMYLGQFPPNTGIGWVLIANGWNGGQVTYGNWILYSNPYFNPEGSQELQKHNVNLYDDNELVVVFGFEDIRRDFSSCDQDFNDALFLVTSNPYNAIETGNFNPISTDGGGQSSGNDGGLESHRGISSNIAQRTFDRNCKPPIAKTNINKTRSSTLLSELVPETLKEGDHRSITSPTDLESITKASQVWSADYILDDECFATVFATETENGVYDHTKIVCDRLAESEIIDIKEISISNQKFILTSLKTRDNSIEYSVSFSVETSKDLVCSVFSRWAVDQYGKGGNFLNYQIWSAAPYLTIDIVKKILSNLQKSQEVSLNGDSLSFVPDIYINKGLYSENAITLSLLNTTNETAKINLVGTLTTSEVDEDLESFFKTISVVPGVNSYTFENPQNDIFDIEIKVSQEGSSQYDVAYFSDGAWGLDYDITSTSVSDLIISSSSNQDKEGHSLARNISVDFESKDYLSVYRHLKPSGGTINLEEYNTLQFESDFSNPITLRIIKDEIQAWDDQFSYVLRPSENTTEYKIPFSYFRNKKGDNFNPNDAKMLVFTQDINMGIDKKLDLKNVAFTKTSASDLEIISECTVYPNPSRGKVIISFESEKSKQGTMSIYNSIGTVIAQEKINIDKGFNVLNKDLSIINKGVYFIHITDGEGISFQDKFILL